MTNDDFIISSKNTGLLKATVATKTEKTTIFRNKIEMNVFVILAFKKNVTGKDIEDFSRDALDFSVKNNTGKRRGNMSGVFAFPVLAAESVEEDAINFCCSDVRKHFGAAEYPAIFDLRKGELHYSRRMSFFWGRGFNKFRVAFAEKYFNPISEAVKSDVWKVETKGSKNYGTLMFLLFLAAALVYALAAIVEYYESGATSLKSIITSLVSVSAAAVVSVYFFEIRPAKNKQRPKTL